jgi:non-lysosomal glucosylceramidase
MGIDKEQDKVEFLQAVTTLRDTGDPQINRAGIPLGGIGAGKIDITPDGSITNITTNCNIEVPICDGSAAIPAKIVAGGVPGIFWGLKDRTGAKILKIHPPTGTKGIEATNIKFDGKLPVAKFEYTQIGPIDVDLTAFSPLILNDSSQDYRDSSIPGAIFEFVMKNTTTEDQDFRFFFSWQNMCGCTGFFNMEGWSINDTRTNKIEFRTNGKYPGGWHYNDNPEAHPRGKGNYSVLIDTDKSFNIESRIWKTPSELWEQLESGEPLKVRDPWVVGSSSIIGVSGSLKPNTHERVRVAVGWYFPNLTQEWNNEVNYGRMYEHWFEDSWQVAEYLLTNADRLYASTTQWQDLLWKSNLPQWFKYKLCDDLFPMITNSWYTRKGEFTISEAVTNMAAMMGTIDQRNGSQAPYLLMFPKLCRSELMLFKERQVKHGDNNQYGYHYDFETGRCDPENLWLDQTGAVPHDIGHDDLGKYYITPDPVWISGHWPDLLSGYVLQWYAYYCWTNDPIFRQECYESCKSTMALLERLDFNKDGIPELWGMGSSSYDNHAFPYYGNSPYIATLYMAALKVMEKLASQENDSTYAEYAKDRRKLAEQTLLQDNWTGSYFRTWRHNEHKKWDGTARSHALESNSIMVSQLAGQWYASMMSLGYLLDYDKIEKTLKTITEHNHHKVPGGAAIEFWPKTDDSDERWSECWPHYTEVYYSALAIYETQKCAGIEQLSKIWKVANKCNARWDSGLSIAGPDNTRVDGRWYMTNTASWFALLAITGVWIDLPAKRFTLAPNPIGPGENNLSAIPFFTEQMTGIVDFESDKNRTKATFTISQFKGNPITFDQILTRVRHSQSPKQIIIDDTIICEQKYKHDKINDYLIIDIPLTLEREGNSVTVEIFY